MSYNATAGGPLGEEWGKSAYLSMTTAGVWFAILRIWGLLQALNMPTASMRTSEAVVEINISGVSVAGKLLPSRFG
jgi:hypothetical protein